MSESTKLTTLHTRILPVLSTLQTDQIINTRHFTDYKTIITKSVVVHISDQYDNRV